MANLSILVVDDHKIFRQLIRNILLNAGYTSIHLATGGRDALEKIDDIEPDLVIMDILMPDMDGFELCRILREQSKYDSLPIIAQTGLEDVLERLKILNEGANDIILKPIEGAELLARTRLHLQNRVLQAQMVSYRDRMMREMKAALELQNTILPSDDDIVQFEAKYNLSIGAIYKPSSELSGDFWGIHQVDENRLAFYSVDFTGHGVAAALNTFRIHSMLLMTETNWAEPDVWLMRLNDNLHKVLSLGQFATVFYGIVDRQNNSFKYASAGAPPVVVLDGPSGNPSLIDTAGLPVGISEAAIYETHELSLTPNGQIFIYSDAYVETRTDKRDRIEEAELLEIVKGVHGIEKGSRRISYLMDAYPGKDLSTLPDDLTLISILTR